MQLGIVDLRVIPARAGNRKWLRKFWRHKPGHPRESGEQSGTNLGSLGDHGSSPRERGTDIRRHLFHFSLRVIPARAGNSPDRQTTARQTPGHPRESGEQMRKTFFSTWIAGSSPRERGTAQESQTCVAARRVIPARAGNRRWQTCRTERAAGHPRESGEQGIARYYQQAKCGSSPRERGTADDFERRRLWCRVIPARAGNSSSRQRRPGRPSGHPRESGEQSMCHCVLCRHAGSSPRERGTAHGTGLRMILRRVIPARAGNRWQIEDRQAAASGHPRESGEQASKWPWTVNAGGSSPRERGTETDEGAEVNMLRVIPARAGNSLRVAVTRENVSGHPRESGEQ